MRPYFPTFGRLLSRDPTVTCETAMSKLLIGYDASEYAAHAIDDLARAGLSAVDVEATVLSIADLLPGCQNRNTQTVENR